jgi:hypothetical protein
VGVAEDDGEPEEEELQATRMASRSVRRGKRMPSL